MRKVKSLAPGISEIVVMPGAGCYLQMPVLSVAGRCRFVKFHNRRIVIHSTGLCEGFSGCIRKSGFDRISLAPERLLACDPSI